MDWKARAAALAAELPALYLALRRRETPWYARALAAVTVGYALSPIDLIPDVIPVLGCLDDLLILPGLAALTLRCIPPEVLAECRAEAGTLWPEGRPKRWYCALPIAAVWLLALVWLLRMIF